MCFALQRTDIRNPCHDPGCIYGMGTRVQFGNRAAYAASPDRWCVFTGGRGGVATCEWWLWLTRICSCTASSFPSSTRDTIFRSLRSTACVEGT